MNPAPSLDKTALRAFFVKRFLLLLILSIILISAGLMGLYALESRSIQTAIVSESSNLAALHKKYIEGVIWQARSDLAYLSAEVDELNANIDSNIAESDGLARLCLLFMRKKPIYDQIRIINTTGKEVLRLNLKPEGPEQVPPAELQNKSSRYYVQAALQLLPEEIYISALDLNIEHETIELPPKPILRFAMPIYAKNGHIHGIVVLNLLGSNLFRELLETESRNSVHAPVPFDTVMLDSNGYWVFNPTNQSKEFGFMYPDKQRMTMAFEYPLDWAAISKATEGQHLGPDGLYVFKTVDATLGTEKIITGPGNPWKVVVFTTTSSLAKAYGTLQKKFFIPCAVLIVLFATGSWFLADAQTRNRFAEEKIAHLAHHDHLTGLANRLLFQDLANLALSTAERNSQQLALLFIDLDRFKPINDTLGHAAGDEALKEVTRRIQGCVRKPDIVARLGGDEFSVILQDVDGSSGALKVAQKIIDVVAVPLSIRGKEQRVGASIGISLYPEDGTDVDTLLRVADSAMYRAKGSGGSRAELAS